MIYGQKKKKHNVKKTFGKKMSAWIPVFYCLNYEYYGFQEEKTNKQTKKTKLMIIIRFIFFF